MALPVLGQGGLPGTGVTAVALNVTVDQPSGPGYVTAYPCSDGAAAWPRTSNYAAGQVVANLATVADREHRARRQVCLFTLRRHAPRRGRRRLLPLIAA